MGTTHWPHVVKHETLNMSDVDEHNGGIIINPMVSLYQPSWWIRYANLDGFQTTIFTIKTYFKLLAIQI